jgi:hypothetical protein
VIDEVDMGPTEEWEVKAAALVAEANACLAAGNMDGYQQKMRDALRVVEEE